MATPPNNGEYLPTAGSNGTPTEDSVTEYLTSPSVWPRSFEHSINLYSQRGRLSNRSSAAGSRDISPPGQRFDRESVKSALTPLLSESNLQELDRRRREDVETKHEHEETATTRSRILESRFLEPEDGIVHLGVHATGKPGASFSETCFNCVNVLIGVGILSTPYAVSQGGWISLTLLVLFSFIFLNTAIFLKDCIESRPYITTYPDIGQAAFGQWGRWIVAILLYIELYSVSVDLLILEGDNLAQMFPLEALNVGPLSITANQIMIILTAVVIFPTVCLRDLSFLAYLSVCGVAASLLVVIGVTVVGFNEGSVFSHRGTALQLSGFPVAIGVYSFCFSGHTVIPNIYCSMKKPEQFSKVLGVSFLFSVVMYSGIAAIGYSMYGDELMSQITLNLPKNSVFSTIAIWTTIVNPLTKFALMITPLAFGIEELFPDMDSKAAQWATSLGIRVAIVVSMVFVALSLPFFGYVMAFIGSCLGMTMSVIIPSACYLSLIEKEAYPWKSKACVVYIVFGAIVAAIGTYSSVSSILGSLGDDTAP